MSKGRLTVSVDPDLLEAGAAAVAAGRVGSISAWVGEAMAEKAATDRRIGALAAAVAAYEREHGLMEDEELAVQARVDRDAAAARRASALRRSTT